MAVEIRVLDKKTLVIKEMVCPESKLGKRGVHGKLLYHIRRYAPILDDRDYVITITHKQEESK